MIAVIPDRLSKALKGRRVVPFVGAGLSRRVDPTRFPSWAELLMRLADTAVTRGYISDTQKIEIADLLNNQMLPFAAEMIRRRIPNDEFDFILDEQFRINSSTFNLADQISLLKIEPPIVITTNFDRLLEDAFARHYLRAPSVSTCVDAIKVYNRLRRTKSTQNPSIFKIHGDIDDIESVIVGERDFKRLMFDERTFDSILVNILLNYTILFVGYSLRDPEVIYHLERNHNLLKRSADPDYIILRKGSMKELELQRWREEYNVEAIFFDGPSDGPELSAILSSLESHL
jgi:hypothetical protein